VQIDKPFFLFRAFRVFRSFVCDFFINGHQYAGFTGEPAFTTDIRFLELVGALKRINEISRCPDKTIIRFNQIIRDLVAEKNHEAGRAAFYIVDISES